MVTKRNDPRLNRHQRLQLQGWRANCHIQIDIDYYACVGYVSSVVKSAFTNVVSSLTDSSDVHTTFKKIMLKTVGNRDYLVQEVMHHLLSLKCVSASFEVITASLDGTRKSIQMVVGSLVLNHQYWISTAREMCILVLIPKC